MPVKNCLQICRYFRKGTAAIDSAAGSISGPTRAGY